MEYLRNILIVKISSQPEALLNSHTCNLDKLNKQAESFHADELQVMFSVLTKVEVEMKRNSLSQMIFEMALLRLIETRPFKKIDELIEKINQAENHFVEPNQNFPIDSKAEEKRPVTTLAKNNASVSWTQIKQQVACTKPFLEHYLDKCKVLVFNEKEIHLSFSDQFTFDLVETPENIQFLKENIKTFFGYEVDINLIFDPPKQDPDVSLEEKKKSIETETGRQKSESEIIQDALDIFGGIVIK